MADILYKTSILIDTINIIDVNTSLELNNKNDFENNYKNQCKNFLDISNSENNLINYYINYSDFKNLVSDWSNVKYIYKNNQYDLYLIIEDNPRDKDGKLYVRAESRPLNMTTCFSMAGDINNEIGGGQRLLWDFSNSDGLTDAPTGYKRKRIEFSFIDPIRIKDGTLYWKNKLFGSYIDFYIVCPLGNYYLDNNKSPHLAEEDIKTDHFVIKYNMLDTCLMGDELNSECASEEIPPNYKFWLEITVPNTDDLSQGYCSLEINRCRTIIL